MEIIVEDVNRGDVNGNLIEREDALKWALGSRDIQSLKESIYALKDFNGTFTTTQQIEKISNWKMSKINYLIKKAGFATTDRLKYHDVVSNRVSKKSIIKYHDNGITILSEKEVVSVGSMYRSRWVQTFKQLATIEDINKHKEQMAKVKAEVLEYFGKKRMAQFYEENELWQGSCINSLFEVSSWEVPELTDRQEKKIKSMTQKYCEAQCPKCKKMVRIPLPENADTDENGKLVFNIHTLFLNDVNNNGCPKCNGKNRTPSECKWNYDGITTFLDGLDKGKWLQFSVSDFCKEFRTDGVVVSVDYLRNRLRAIHSGIKTIEGENNKVGVLLC